MKIGDICKYAPKSKIKAGEAIDGAEYMFFTSSSEENKRYSDYQLDGEGIIMGTGGNATLHYYSGKFSTSTDCVVLLPNESIRCKYLYYFFKANMNVLEAGFKGAGLKHTNKAYISDISIDNIPALEEQDRLIILMDKLQQVIDNRKNELVILDELIKARFVE
ncbi:MAG: restriction endonuclease subunit S, partial [Pseudobutyrivibrio sp.]|uniref:restriction endonuclease subunit S n=1 Tax=Pseudobutyrivibrio sp. TaxID=2014367 RepID=UPI0025DB22A9